jgi:hypothetical protein
VQHQEPSSSSDVGSDLFEDWLEANDMATSVYVALIAEPSSSQAPIANASCRGFLDSMTSLSSGHIVEVLLPETRRH